MGIYRSPKVPVQQLCQAITEVLNGFSPENIIILGDLNVSWLIDTEKRPLYNLLVKSVNITNSCYYQRIQLTAKQSLIT